MEKAITVGLLWKLRRVAADLRQQDVANAIGISITRYSGIERGDHVPTDLETRLLEQFLPSLPSAPATTAESSDSVHWIDPAEGSQL
jgi:transcriptional regulator with XRE-family HTH domain